MLRQLNERLNNPPGSDALNIRRRDVVATSSPELLIQCPNVVRAIAHLRSLHGLDYDDLQLQYMGIQEPCEEYHEYLLKQGKESLYYQHFAPSCLTMWNEILHGKSKFTVVTDIPPHLVLKTMWLICKSEYQYDDECVSEIVCKSLSIDPYVLCIVDSVPVPVARSTVDQVLVGTRLHNLVSSWLSSSLTDSQRLILQQGPIKYRRELLRKIQDGHITLID